VPEIGAERVEGIDVRGWIVDPILQRRCTAADDDDDDGRGPLEGAIDSPEDRSISART
jgi:hypothetical protein